MATLLEKAFPAAEGGRVRAGLRPPAGEVVIEESRVQSTAQELRRLGERKEAQLQYFAAEQFYLRSLAVISAAAAANPVIALAAARSLSLLYAKTGRIALARWYARRALGICLRQEVTHWEAVKTMAFYGAFLFRLRHYRSAVRYLRRAYLIGKAQCLNHTPLQGDIADLLADVYYQRLRQRRGAALQRLSRRLRQRHAAA